MSEEFKLEQQKMPLRLGEVRSSDGYLFRGYKTEYTKSGEPKKREVWLSPSVWKAEIERKKRWHLENRERKREMDKKYRQRPAVKKKAQLYMREYRAVRGEELLSKKRKYRAENKEKCAAAVARWVEQNRSRANFLRSNYRARIKGAMTSSDDSRKAIIETFYEAARRISDWTGIIMHVDHIIPLARGGSHTPDNLQILPRHHNSAKKHRMGTIYEKWGHVEIGGGLN